MTFAIVYVFPDPVTPRRVWYCDPDSKPSTSSLMAPGWSPAGEKGAVRVNPEGGSLPTSWGARRFVTVLRFLSF
jgi:hypothetical protein